MDVYRRILQLLLAGNKALFSKTVSKAVWCPLGYISLFMLAIAAAYM